MSKLYERIIELALTRSFFFPSNEIYGQTAGFYDYGPVGILIKNKIQNLWRQMFLKEEGHHEIESSMVTPQIVLEASGHVSNFADPVVDCKKCNVRFRADSLIESTIKDYKWNGKLESLTPTIKENNIKCPNCKSELSHAYMFNLMFKTGIGGEQSSAFMRPETAQGTFTAFSRIFRNHGAKLPLGVAQIGRSYRNEISPRKGLVRMREFTQMELEYFFNPSNQKIEDFEKISSYKMCMKINEEFVDKTAKELVEEKIVANEIMAHYMVKEWKFYRTCGLNPEKIFFRVLSKYETPHYSKANIDMEVETSHGILETIGNAYRTDYDLSQHAKYSKQDLAVFVEEEKKRLIPHVFEAALGVDRMFFCILEHAFREKSKEKDWEWFDLPPLIAPYEVAVFPLMKKDGLADKAKEIVVLLRSSFDVLYQESGSIGRRYARADEIGVPYSITVDYDTLKDNAVTVRYRNDGAQERININDLTNKIKENISQNKVRLA